MGGVVGMADQRYSQFATPRPLCPPYDAFDSLHAAVLMYQSPKAPVTAMKPASFQYHAPKTIEEALALLAEHAPDDGRVLAGG
jgi:hypothetical protein